MKAALIPGSFDPITLGHLDVIRRAAGMFDKVYVAVMTNDMTKYEAGAVEKKYMFDMAQRRTMAGLACADISNAEVVEWGGMLIDAVDKFGVCAVIKGVRDEKDFVYEQKHAHWNVAHNPRAQTLYMPADISLDSVSSSLVRERIAKGEDVSDILPIAVAEYIRDTLHPSKH